MDLGRDDGGFLCFMGGVYFVCVGDCDCVVVIELYV